MRHRPTAGRVMLTPGSRLRFLDRLPRWRSTAAIVGLVVVSLAWYSAARASAGQRVDDLAQLAHMTHAGSVLAAVASWWIAFCDDGARMNAALVALQTACVAAAAAAAWMWTRSPAVSVVVALVALSSPFPGGWLDRPIGGVDGVTALTMIAVFATGAAASRRAAALQCVGVFVAVLFSGWPALAVLAFAIVRRGSTAVRLALAVATALVVRLIIGIPPAHVLGSFAAPETRAVELLRCTVIILFAIPAIVYLLTRPPVARRLRADVEALGPDTVAGAAAVLVLVPSATFARSGAFVAAYVGELAIVLAIASAVRRAPALQVLRAALALATVLVVTGVAARLGHPVADDSARVANDRSVVRALGDATSVVIVQDESPRRYTPSLLSYYAGHDVRAEYVTQTPAAIAGPVLFASAGGLNRIDGAAHAVQAAADARRRMTYDMYAHRSEGIINDRTPQGTPSKLGVIAEMPLPGPFGEVPTMTVVAAFSYTFDRVPVQAGSRLVYLAAKVFPVGERMRATVSIQVAGGARVEQHDDLPPAPPAGPLSWQFRSIAIPATRRTTARIVFAAASPNDKNVGDWAAFGSPMIVTR